MTFSVCNAVHGLVGLRRHESTKWGHRWWGVDHRGGVKWAKNKKNEKIGKNRQKIIKKNEIVPDFLLKITATTFHPPYQGKKKSKSLVGWPMAVRKCGKHYLTSFGHHLALDSRGYGLVMNLAWLFVHKQHWGRTQGQHICCYKFRLGCGAAHDIVKMGGKWQKNTWLKQHHKG